MSFENVGTPDRVCEVATREAGRMATNASTKNPTRHIRKYLLSDIFRSSQEWELWRRPSRFWFTILALHVGTPIYFKEPPPANSPRVAGRFSNSSAHRQSTCPLEASMEFAAGTGEQTCPCTRTARAMAQHGRREAWR